MDFKEVTFDVPGVNCNHCIHAITEATKGVGVEDVQVDLVSKKVYVSYDPAKVEDTAIKAAIEDEGYEVTAETIGKAIPDNIGGKKQLNVM
jgi:copper chaperone